MKELDTKDMDKEEKELYQMLRSKFNTEEMERLAKLMIIDAEKYHQEQLKKNCVLDLVSNPLPTKEEVIAEGDKQIKDWLMGNSFEERTTYRIGFRRSFEYVLRFIK